MYGVALGVEDALKGLPYESQVVLYVDIPLEETVRRGKKLGDNDLLEEDVEFLETVEDLYESYFEVKRVVGCKVVRIDGLTSREEMFETAKEEILKYVNRNK